MLPTQPARFRRFAQFAWAVLAINVAVIVLGAYVRATGSGAGCGDHWPLCNGVVIPIAPKLATIIEFSHRATSGIALVLVILMTFWAFRLFEPHHPVRRSAAFSLGFIFGEALIGAGLVLLKLVGTNASIARVIYLSAHLINTLLLLAALSLTAWWGSGHSSARLRLRGSFGPTLGIGLFAVILTAVAGAITALGDTLFPAGSLAAGMRQDFSATAHFLIRLRIIHPVIAIATGLYLIGLVIVTSVLRPTKSLNAWGGVVATLVVIQILSGAVNLYFLAPVWMQLVHLLLADFLWIALVLFCSEASNSVPLRSNLHQPGLQIEVADPMSPLRLN